MHPIEARIAVADAFDTGRLPRQATTAEIADATGVRLNSLTRLKGALNFKGIKSKTQLWEQIPHRYAPPRNFPRLNGRVGPVTKAVLALYESGQWSGPCYVRDLVPLIDGSTDDAVGRSLERLKFKLVKRRHKKAIGYAPAIWERPRDWPDILQQQRELLRLNVSPGKIHSTTDSAAGLGGIIKDAWTKLAIKDIPLDKRGAMKAQIKEVIIEAYEAGRKDIDPDNISILELAGLIGESPNSPKAALRARMRHMVNYVMTKTCEHCGQKVRK